MDVGVLARIGRWPGGVARAPLSIAANRGGCAGVGPREGDDLEILAKIDQSAG